MIVNSEKYIWLAAEEAFDYYSPLPEDNDDRIYRLAITILACHANKVNSVIGLEAHRDFLNEIGMDVAMLSSEFKSRDISEESK